MGAVRYSEPVRNLADFAKSHPLYRGLPPVFDLDPVPSAMRQAALRRARLE